MTVENSVVSWVRKMVGLRVAPTVFLWVVLSANERVAPKDASTAETKALLRAVSSAATTVVMSVDRRACDSAERWEYSSAGQSAVKKVGHLADSWGEQKAGSRELLLAASTGDHLAASKAH